MERLLKVAQESDPACQGKNAHYGTRDEARARDRRSRVEALSEDDSKEAARNSSDQNNIASLFERQSDHARYPEAKGWLKQCLAEDRPPHAPAQIETLRRHQQSSQKQRRSGNRCPEDSKAPIDVTRHDEVYPNHEEAEYRRPDDRRSDRSPQTDT